MRLTLVNLPELLLVVYLDSDSILEHILDVLTPLHLLSVLCLHHYHFLEV